MTSYSLFQLLKHQLSKKRGQIKAVLPEGRVAVSQLADASCNKVMVVKNFQKFMIQVIINSTVFKNI